MRGHYYRLRADHYHWDGSVNSRLLPGAFAQFAEAAAEAAREQTRFDAQGVAVTVYVVDASDVPVWRLGAFDPPPQVDDDDGGRLRLRRIE